MKVLLRILSFVLLCPTRALPRARSGARGPALYRRAFGELGSSKSYEPFERQSDQHLSRDVAYHVRKKRLESAVASLWRGLRSEDCSPGALRKCLSLVVDGLCRSRRVQAAEELAMRFHAASGLNFSSVIASSLIHGFGTIGQPDEALRHFRALRTEHGLEPDVWCFATVTFALSRNGRMEQALELYREMLEDGVEPNLVVFNGLMDGAAKAGDYKSAQMLLSELQKANIMPSQTTYNSLIMSYLTAKEFGRAELILRHLEEGYTTDQEIPCIVSYSLFVAAYGKKGDMKKSLEFLYRARQRGLAPTAHTYHSLLTTAGKMRSLTLVQHVLTEIERDGLKKTDPILQAIIRALSSCNAIEKAQSFHDELCANWKSYLESKGIQGTDVAIQLDRSERGLLQDPEEFPPRPTAMTFVTLAKCYASAGDIAAAQETLLAARTMPGCTPPVSASKLVYSQLPPHLKKQFQYQNHKSVESKVLKQTRKKFRAFQPEEKDESDLARRHEVRRAGAKLVTLARGAKSERDRDAVLERARLIVRTMTASSDMAGALDFLNNLRRTQLRTSPRPKGDQGGMDAQDDGTDAHASSQSTHLEGLRFLDILPF